MGAYAVSSTDLGKRFGGMWAVKASALAVPAGAIYGFLGPNGAGKTTTIRMMLGLTRPTTGSIQVYGHDVVRNRLTASRMIGALLDARATYDHLTGRDNLDITRRLLNLPLADIDRVLDFVSLAKDSARRVGHYSLGMRQRLGLARALLGSPKLLVLDEPMNGLDPDGIRDMRAVIRELPARTGATVFLSSHLLDEVERIATDIGVMHEGQLVLQGSIRDVLAHVPTQLCVRALNIGTAEACMSALGYSVDRRDDSLVVALTRGDDEAVEIGQQLQTSSAELIEMTHRRGSLESLYVQLASQRTQTQRKAA
jgi:lantibiotic transport system ATP-binding protein